MRSFDPSGTYLLRRSFYADIKRRMKAIEKSVWKIFVTEDVLGWKEKHRKPFSFNTEGSFVTFTVCSSFAKNIDPQQFQFATDAAKIKMFRTWLKQQVSTGLLEIKGGTKGKPWTATYVESAYIKGMIRAYNQTHKKDLLKGSNWFGGSQAQFLKTAFGQPVMMSQLELLATRSYNLLDGISNTMSDRMALILAEGLAHGKAPVVIAREMRKVVQGLTKNRALMIARTEIMNAHAEGTLDSFQLLGISEVEAEVEFSTAGDELVCKTCASLEGKVYKVADARGVIPVHPNCRCSWSTIVDKSLLRKR